MSLERLYLKAWIEGLQRQGRPPAERPAAPPAPIPAPRTPRIAPAQSGDVLDDLWWPPDA